MKVLPQKCVLSGKPYGDQAVKVKAEQVENISELHAILKTMFNQHFTGL